MKEVMGLVKAIESNEVEVLGKTADVVLVKLETQRLVQMAKRACREAD